MTRAEDPVDVEVDLLLDAIYRRYGHDFRGYARPTLRRRLGQALDAFGCESISLLQHRALRDPGFVSQLLGFLTVQVSDVFRDPGFFRSIRTNVVPLLRTYPSIKLWIAGCGTGEEVYSFAILLAEEDLLRRSIIYATDVSADALRVAERGVYALDRAQAFSKNYQAAGGTRSLGDYSTAAYDGVVFDRALRANAVFSDHSLATDSVFAEVHLVSCRNVLIYFDGPLRDRAVGLFKDSLVRRGFLGLGARENLRSCAHAGTFAALDPEHRIYQLA